MKILTNNSRKKYVFRCYKSRNKDLMLLSILNYERITKFHFAREPVFTNFSFLLFNLKLFVLNVINQLFET